MKIPNPKRLACYAAMIGGVALVASGTSFALNSSDHPENHPQTPLNLKVDSNPVDRNQKLANSFSPIVQKVAPSVVKVSVTAKNPQRQMSGNDLDMFRRFFGNNGPGFS